MKDNAKLKFNPKQGPNTLHRPRVSKVRITASTADKDPLEKTTEIELTFTANIKCEETDFLCGPTLVIGGISITIDENVPLFVNGEIVVYTIQDHPLRYYPTPDYIDVQFAVSNHVPYCIMEK